MTAPERRPGTFAASVLLSGASALWLAAAMGTLFAGPQYGRYYVDLEQDPHADARVGLLLVAAVLVMMVAAAAGLLVAVLGARGWPPARALMTIFEAVAAVVAVVLLLVGVPAGVNWHGWLISGTAVMSLAFLAAAALEQRPAASRARRREPTRVEAPAAAGTVEGPARRFRGSAARRDVPRWGLALAALVAFLFAITAGILGVRGAGQLPAPAPTAAIPARNEPPHDVIYMVTAPAAVTWLEITYVDAQGEDQRLAPTSGGPPWVQTIRTGPDAVLLYLAVTLTSHSRDTKIQCAIYVDGRAAISSEGPSCNLDLRFPRPTPAHS